MPPQSPSNSRPSDVWMSSPAPEAPLSPPRLPADIQAEILSRVGDAVSVVRCAATCKAWRHLIKEPAFLTHLRRRRRVGGFDPSTLLGFFFRDASQRLPRRRLYRRRLTRFLLGNSQPQPSAPVVLPLSRFLTTVDDLDSFAPVAFGGGGLVALCRFQRASRHTVGICVCNPLAETSTLLPPLPPFVIPEKIVFLEADSSSFRLLAVMDDQQGTLIMRVFSSPSFGEGDWDTLMTAELPDDMVVHIGSPGVVHRGAVHWICGTRTWPHAVHAVAARLTDVGTSLSRLDPPARAGAHGLTTASNMVRLFKLNLEEKKLVKVCKSHFTKYLCPYVTDFASCLEAMKSF